MAINSLGINLNRREWLKTATGVGALALAAPLVNFKELHAEERSGLTKEAIRIDKEAKIPFEDSAVALFGSQFAQGETSLKILSRTGNGRDILYEVLRNTPQKLFANKTWSVKGKNDWDFVRDLREFSMYVLDAHNPQRPEVLNGNFTVNNLRKKNNFKVSLDEIVAFGINIKSGRLASLTLGAIAAGWSPFNLSGALELINRSLDVLDYENSSMLMRRNIEKVIANKMFGETATEILHEAFKYKLDQDTLIAEYEAGDSFANLSQLAIDYDEREKHRKLILSDIENHIKMKN